MDPILEFSGVSLTLDNVIIPNERLRNTPSLKDGCPHDLEVDLRIVGCDYIQKAGILLRLPQVAMATAQVLFQRFFYSKSFVKFNMLYVAMACIFLAGKIEENCRRVRDVANVFHRLKQQGMGRTLEHMDYMGEEYFKIKASIIKYERFILKELGFCVHVKHPHKIIIAYLQILESEKNQPLVQKSWNYMNDSLRTNVFVRFTPESIACACIFLSARDLKVPLPQKPPWWTVFDVNYEDIEAIALEIKALYSKPKLFLLDLENKLSVIKEAFRKKQIEIKEVKLKKPTAGTSGEGSGASPSPGDVGKVVDPSSKDSVSPMPATRQLLPSPQPTSQRSSPQNTITTTTTTTSPAAPGSSPNQVLINGSRNSIKRHTPSTSPHPPPPSKRRKGSSSPLPTESRPSHTTEKPREERVKPIISPIRVAGGGTASSGGESSSEGSGSSPLENGIPEQYRQDFSKHHKSSRKSHHSRYHSSHSSSSHHHQQQQQHRHRSGRSRHEDSSSSRHHQQHREREREREREEAGRYRRGRDQPTSKPRRGELERYR